MSQCKHNTGYAPSPLESVPSIGWHAAIPPVGRIMSIASYCLRMVFAVVVLSLSLCLKAQCYRVGDVVTNVDGSRGLVFYLNPDDSGGWMVALDDAVGSAYWGTRFDVPAIDNRDPVSNSMLLSDTAGYANTVALLAYFEGVSGNYAVRNVDVAHGWYVPTAAQLSVLYASLVDIEPLFALHGGTTPNATRYWSSSERDATRAWMVYFTNGHFYGDELKTASAAVRAVRTFSYDTTPFDTTLTYVWNTGDTTPSIEVSPTMTTRYSVSTTNRYGCGNSASHLVVVGNERPQHIYDTVCVGTAYRKYGFDLSADATAAPGLLTRTDTLTDSDCYAVVTLHLYVVATYSEVLDTFVCDGSDFLYNGVSYTDSGVYDQTFTAVNGCDSVVTLHLSTAATYALETFDTVCSDQTVDFGNRTCGQSGVYRYHFTTAQGCDSMVLLHLMVHPIEATDRCDTVCPGTAVSFADTLYSIPGSYSHTYSTVHGCDSMVTLHLVNYETLHLTILGDTLLCQDQVGSGTARLDLGSFPVVSYLWSTGDTTSDIAVTMPGWYGVTTTDTNGCVDSTVVWVDMVAPPLLTIDDIDFCLGNIGQVGPGADFELAVALGGGDCRLSVGSSVSGDTGVCALTSAILSGPWCSPTSPTSWQLQPPTWVVRDTAVDYTLHYADRYGCQYDTMFPISYHQPTERSECDTVVENLMPVQYGGASFYTDVADTLFVFTDRYGCDSVVHYSLHVLRNSRSVVDTEVCDIALPLWWRGHLYMTAGSAFDTLANSVGADSVVELRLSINPSYYLYDSVVTCDAYFWHDSLYRTSTSEGNCPSVMLATDMGCDSVRALLLTLHYANAATVYDTMAESVLPYRYHTHLLWGDTVLTNIHLTNAYGCDSVVEYHLIVNRNVYDTVDSTVCSQALPFVWDGHNFHSQGSCIDTLVSHNGADSIVLMRLWVNMDFAVDRYDTICQGDTLDFYGTVCVQTGTYSHHFQTVDGCDSLIRLHLIVMPSYRFDFYDTVYIGTQRPFEGHLCDTTGEYAYSYTTEWGCDSLRVLHLIAERTVRLDSTVCVNQLPLLWNGVLFAAAGVETAVFADYLGYDSTVVMTLTVLDTSRSDTSAVGCGLFRWNGETYYATGQYTYTGHNALGCDSTAHLVLEIRPNVYDTVSDTFCAGAVYLFAGSYLSQPGVYADTLASANGCDSVVSLVLQQLDYPEVSIAEEHTCSPPLYTLTPRMTEGTLFHWSSDPVDSTTAWDDSLLLANPQQPTRYILTADYRERPLCPASDTLLLMPIVPVTAAVDIIPSVLTFDNPDFEAVDLSTGNTFRYWYVDGMPYADSLSEQIQYSLHLQDDTVVVVLVAANDLCADTVRRLVPLHRTAIYFPNVFTPTQYTNTLFAAKGVGIEHFELWVYTRTGSLVYHSTDINRSWDGTSQGHACPQGVYVYKCRYRSRWSNGYQTATGTVTLLR